MNKILVAFFTILIIVMPGCKTGDAGDPKEVLAKFFDAITNKNIDEAKKYATKDSEGMMSLVQMGMQNMGDKENGMMNYEKGNVEIGSAAIDGDKATIPVKDKKSGEMTDFTLRKEDGAWKVAFDKSTLMEMAQKKMKEHGMGDMRKNMGDSMPTMPKMDSNDRAAMDRAEKIADSIMNK
ncbi:MAG: hypothetical protein ABIN25_08730 [Ginsengibacter sp.]